jgi:hypothetical protein
MFLNLRAECQRFQSLRVEFDAIAQELKHTKNRARRQVLAEYAREIALEGNELFWHLQSAMVEARMFLSKSKD